VLGVLKLSHKYDVVHLIRRTMPVFTAIYPPHLHKWDIRKSRRQWGPLSTRYGRALPFFVVQLARTTGLDILLPAALLDCCSCTIEEIIAGISAPDGSVITLHPKDQALVLGAREELSKFLRDQMFLFLYKFKDIPARRWPPAPPIADLPTKLHELLQCGSSEQKDWTCPFTMNFPWDTYYGMLRMTTRDIKVVQTGFRDLRKRWWQSLPGVFALPAWDKIRRDSMR
jgi:hypothetical protein